MKIKNVGSNMTELQFKDCTVLVSYETPVAICIHGQGYYKTDEKYSVTTSKHITKWLKGANAETKPQSYFDCIMER